MNYMDFDGGSWTPSNGGMVCTHHVYCSTCCLDRHGPSPFVVYAGTRKDAVKRWNRQQNENYLEEQQYNRELEAHEEAFNAVYSTDTESRV